MPHKHIDQVTSKLYVRFLCIKKKTFSKFEGHFDHFQEMALVVVHQLGVGGSTNQVAKVYWYQLKDLPVRKRLFA